MQTAPSAHRIPLGPYMDIFISKNCRVSSIQTQIYIRASPPPPLTTYILFVCHLNNAHFRKTADFIEILWKDVLRNMHVTYNSEFPFIYSEKILQKLGIGVSNGNQCQASSSMNHKTR